MACIRGPLGHLPKTCHAGGRPSERSPFIFTLSLTTNCFSSERATATSSLSRSSCIFHQILFEAESLLRAAAGANAVRTGATLMLVQPPPLGFDG